MKKLLIDIFNRTNYQSRENGLTSNLATQFTDYAIEQITDKLIIEGVLVLPCKVGSSIWYINKEYSIKEATVHCFDIRTTGRYMIASYYDYETEDTIKCCFRIEELNIGYWLKKEEAEAELFKLKGETQCTRG